jgi:L-lactate dehydrogenase complex protein LldG
VSEARDEVLGRIRAALGSERASVEVPRGYRTTGSRSGEEVLRLFAERVADYRGAVEVTDDPAGAVARVLEAQGARRVVVPFDLPEGLRPEAVEAVVDEGLSPAELDALDGVVTTCAAACAETGSIALDGGPGQGRRALSLVPDLHVCVVRAEQVVETVPELVARLEPSARAGRPIVIVSGPSATSDIELQRVEGVHGPRRLVVVLAGRLGV